MEIAIRKFENRPSVQARSGIVRDIFKEATALNNKENGTLGNIPTQK